MAKPKLIIVDDEPDMLDFLERALRRRYDVTRCNSAEDALEKLRAETYEVLVTDQKMPKVSGLEMLDTIRAEQPDLVRVLISGFTDVPDIQRAIDRGAIHNYILKPVDSRKVLDAIAEAYKVQRGETELVPPA